MGEALITRRGGGLSGSIDPQVIATKSVHWDGTAQTVQIVLPKNISQYRSLIIQENYTVTKLTAGGVSSTHYVYIGNKSIAIGSYSYGSAEKGNVTSSGVLKVSFLPVVVKPDKTTCSMTWTGSTSGLLNNSLYIQTFDSLETNIIEVRGTLYENADYYGDFTWTITGC